MDAFASHRSFFITGNGDRCQCHCHCHAGGAAAGSSAAAGLVHVKMSTVQQEPRLVRPCDGSAGTARARAGVTCLRRPVSPPCCVCACVGMGQYVVWCLSLDAGNVMVHAHIGMKAIRSRDNGGSIDAFLPRREPNHHGLALALACLSPTFGRRGCLRDGIRCRVRGSNHNVVKILVRAGVAEDCALDRVGQFLVVIARSAYEGSTSTTLPLEEIFSFFLGACDTASFNR